MWNSLRADFKEFVSTVADDTSNALSKLDAGMEGDNGNILTADDGSHRGDADKNSDSETSEVVGDRQSKGVDHSELKEIMDLLRDHPGTYTKDLAGEVEEGTQVEDFFRYFSIEAKTDDISKTLKEHEDTVKKHFEELVPTQVAYEDFWKRYYYRCNEERIVQQLQEETERARQAKAEAIENGLKTVTNFFGGAVKAVTKTIAPVGVEGGDDGESLASSVAGVSFFGAKGRPPFVMNTAVSESGDDGSADEEELGWDDDEEEEDATIEEIEFTDKLSEDLQEKLKQAIDERDQIQQTVHMQAVEIKSLQEKLCWGTSGSSVSADEGEVEQLKLKLFETDAELAVLKARVHDEITEDEGGDKMNALIRELKRLPSDELAELKVEVFGKEEAKGDANEAVKISALEHQLQELRKDLISKDAALADTKKKIESSMQQLERAQSQLASDRAQAQTANAAVSKLMSKLKAAQDENTSLKQDAQTTQKENASQISSLKQKQDESQQQVSLLTTQLYDFKRQLRQAEESLKQKDAELETVKRKTTLSSTRDSYSIGEEVDTPTFTTPMNSAATNDSTEEDLADAWDDDW